MKWEERYRINVNDTDWSGIVSLSGLFRMMQDTADLQMAGERPSYDELLAAGHAFVLSRIGVSVYAPLTAHEEIRCQTWSVASRGAAFNRCYRILRGGDIVAEATSVWALVGVEDRKLRRVGEVPMHYSEDEPLELDLPARFRIPPDTPLALVGERTVLYADVDRNGHMNNTRYPDIFCSYLPDMRRRRVISATFSFQSEAPLGETEKIYCGEDDGTYYVRSVRPSGAVNAEAELMLEAL